jgi:hypothetical protein
MKCKPGPVATIPATVKKTRATVYKGKSSEEGSDMRPGLMEGVPVGWKEQEASFSGALQ